MVTAVVATAVVMEEEGEEVVAMAAGVEDVVGSEHTSFKTTAPRITLNTLDRIRRPRFPRFAS